MCRHVYFSYGRNKHAIDCTTSLLHSESTSQQILGMGLDDIAAISTPDAILVVRKERSQDVKKTVRCSS